MLSSMTSTAWSFCIFRGSGLTRGHKSAEVKVRSDRKRVILSWLRPEESRRDNPVAVVGPNDEMR